MKKVLHPIIRYGLYPLLLIGTLLVIVGAVKGHWDLKVALWCYLTGQLAMLIVIEQVFPLSGDWQMTKASFVRDLKYLVASGITIGVVRAGFGTLTLFVTSRHQGLLAHTELIPSVVVFFLVFEFLQYWLHRYSHEGQGALGHFLWRMHVAHHLPDRVYVVMHGVFHPGNALLTALLLQASMLGLGLSPEAAFAAMLLVDLQTMISHFNVDVRAGLLNYIFVGAELHRYHHSSRIEESKNYGSVIPLWDLLFGTFLYQPGRHPARLGLDGTGQYPPSQDLPQVLALPFRQLPHPETAGSS